MHSFAPLSNLKIFVKIADFFQFFSVFSKNFAKFAKILLNFHQILPFFFGISPKCNIFLKYLIFAAKSFNFCC